MSSPQDSENIRAALENAQVGARLLGIGEYEAATAVCTVAVALESGSLAAYRTRAEAYQRLGREKEAEADLAQLEMKQAANRSADSARAIMTRLARNLASRLSHRVSC